MEPATPDDSNLFFYRLPLAQPLVEFPWRRPVVLPPASAKDSNMRHAPAWLCIVQNAGIRPAHPVVHDRDENTLQGGDL